VDLPDPDGYHGNEIARLDIHQKPRQRHHPAAAEVVTRSGHGFRRAAFAFGVGEW
jgi:hypothetical protein